MVIRTRIRAILHQLALLAGAAAAITYFSYQAFNGEHGIQARQQFDQQKQDLGSELTSLQKERAALARRVSLLRSQSIDPDMLEEKARDILGMVSANDEVVLLNK
ncbi:FtsB family cell division protein [Labrys neptuniae]